jgi:hypothetical protein
MAGYTRDEHIEMMQNPDRWPVFPVLPLVREGRKFNDPEKLGFLFCGALRGANTDPTVLVGVLGMTKHGEKLPRKKYESFEALYDDGWRVD